MRILIAPDKFKDALGARDVAEAIAAGCRDVAPDAELVVAPMGDGGEGTAEILGKHRAAERRVADVHDPLGRPCDGEWWYVTSTATAILEMAQAAGLWRLKPEERNPLRTTTYGVGELIAAALDSGCREIIICAGGSATVDGGAGCLQALGFTLVSRDGSPIAAHATGADLAAITEIQLPSHTKYDNVRFVVLADVSSSLLGSDGAARAFGPQKGASSADVVQLEAGMTSFADALDRLSGGYITKDRGVGAAGGLVAGLVAGCRAEVRSGAEYVAEVVLPPVDAAPFDLCLTGEGRIDQQSALGKVVGMVARAAKARGAATIALVGRLAADRITLMNELGLSDIIEISPRDLAIDEILRRTPEFLRLAAANTVARRIARGNTK